MNPATEFFWFEFQGDVRGPDERLLKEAAGLGAAHYPFEEEPGETTFGKKGDLSLLRPRPDLWFIYASSHAHEEDRQAAETLRQTLLQAMDRMRIRWIDAEPIETAEGRVRRPPPIEFFYRDFEIEYRQLPVAALEEALGITIGQVDAFEPQGLISRPFGKEGTLCFVRAYLDRWVITADSYDEEDRPEAEQLQGRARSVLNRVRVRWHKPYSREEAEYRRFRGSGW